MNHDSKALRDSAKGERCVSCGVLDGTIVWAHSNEIAHGKGRGIKSHDLLGLYLCKRCHYAYDHGMSKAEAHQFFRLHYPITMNRVAEKLAAGELRL